MAAMFAIEGVDTIADLVEWQDKGCVEGLCEIEWSSKILEMAPFRPSIFDHCVRVSSKLGVKFWG